MAQLFYLKLYQGQAYNLKSCCEGRGVLTLETLALVLFMVANFTSSTQLIKPSISSNTYPSTQHLSFFPNLPPLFKSCYAEKVFGESIQITQFGIKILYSSVIIQPRKTLSSWKSQQYRQIKLRLS